jgi:RNA polymerase sigma factor (sigma-70 family)
MSRQSTGRARSAPQAPQRADAAASTPMPASAWGAHLSWLKMRLRGRVSPDLAEDLAQEAYLRVTGRDASSPIENPRALLLAVAANLARDSFRRARVRADHAAEAHAVFTERRLDGHTAEDDLQVREAILSLPPKLREVLLLRKVGGLTNREIAQRCGLSVRAIDKRLQKAVTLFVARLRD